MNNALKYGVLIGVVSGFWILMMHYLGVYEKESPGGDDPHLLEYASIIIPFTGLYLGIKSFRDSQGSDKMEFFEGVMEGFKIMIVGALITFLFAAVYVQYSSNAFNTDYMGRIGGALIIGTLFNLSISLALMNKQKNL
ncbi:MAG: hypothetical protein JWN56_368 [Sphingobacteriales bacterium]|nr:hypothetical protein [Sphingobacteriales bacterium]